MVHGSWLKDAWGPGRASFVQGATAPASPRGCLRRQRTEEWPGYCEKLIRPSARGRMGVVNKGIRDETMVEGSRRGRC